MLPSIDPLFALSGLLVGLLVGQTGVGGGSLMTPLLVLLFGVHPATAVGTDLLYASLTKSVGTFVHGMNRTIDWRITGRLAAGSVPASLLTLLAMSHLNTADPGFSRTVSLILCVMLLLTAASLILRGPFLSLAIPATERLSRRRATWLTVAVGATLGVLVPISSVGAGALGVTALLLLYPRVPMATIVGSDIAHAVPLTLVAGLGHVMLGSVDWGLLLSLLCGSVPGIIVGSWLAGRVPETILRSVLAATLIVVSVQLAR